MNWRDDPYIPWLKNGVAGFCNDDNIEAMSIAVENMPDGAVIEIGSFLGRSACFISRLIEIAGRTNPFFTVDDWFFEGYQPTPTMDRWRAFNEAAFKVATSYLLSAPPFHLKVRSRQFFELWQARAPACDLFERKISLGGPIAFAFIDGDHSYEAALGDGLSVMRDLAPSGYILFDDSRAGDDNAHQGCRKAALEIAAQLELVGEFPNVLVRRPS